MQYIFVLHYPTHKIGSTKNDENWIWIFMNYLYLEPMTCDLNNARFFYCHFNETIFLYLSKDKMDPNKQKVLVQLTWNTVQLETYDLKTNAS